MSKTSKCGSRSSCCCDCCESCGCGCGSRCKCSGEGGFERRYQTRAEQIAELEPYLTDLKAEMRAVEEKLADLKRKK
jgi:hypothetical protein